MSSWFEDIASGVGEGLNNLGPGGLGLIGGPSWSDVGDFTSDVIGGVTGRTQANAAKDAARIQAEQQQKALDLQRQMFEQNQANMQPWLQTGTRALGQLESMNNQGAFSMPDYQSPAPYQAPQPFSFDYSQYQNDPGFQFQLQQGMRALDNSASARGGALGGNQQRTAQQFGTGLASQNYGEAFQRALGGYQTNANVGLNAYQTNANTGLAGYQANMMNKGQNFGRYSQLAGLGQTTGQNLGQLGVNYANQAGQGYGNIGDAYASGITGAANARAQGATGLLNSGFNFLGGALSAGLAKAPVK